jgi:hypothetical protein
MLVAVDSGAVDVDGVAHTVTKGVTRVRANHKLVQQAPHLFTELEPHYPDVEDTTAAPGAKRGQ